MTHPKQNKQQQQQQRIKPSQTSGNYPEWPDCMLPISKCEGLKMEDAHF